MCYHNYTQHSGCGHLGECHSPSWTLCADAEQRLASLRGPMSPPLYTPTAGTMAPPPKRSTTLKASTRRALSVLGRQSSTASASSRRAAPGPAVSRASTSSFASVGGDLGIADHELEIVKCRVVERRTMVSSDMRVCKECERWIKEMSFMIQRWKETGSVKGTNAFEEFLKMRGEDVAEYQLAPLRNSGW